MTAAGPGCEKCMTQYPSCSPDQVEALCWSNGVDSDEGMFKKAVALNGEVNDFNVAKTDGKRRRNAGNCSLGVCSVSVHCIVCVQ